MNLIFNPGRAISQKAEDAFSRIIGSSYSNSGFHGILNEKAELEIGVVSRFGKTYSESNMGFGEGRTLRLIDWMERAPNKSLFIIEEPETALHAESQYELAKYFLDVCARKRHQLIFSTHSYTIAKALPANARKLLIRDISGVRVENEVSHQQVHGLLTGNHERRSHIFVEDDFAKELLTEVLRKLCNGILGMVRIDISGDKDKAKKDAERLNGLGYCAIAVRDPDVGKAGCNTLFTLPGSKSPEEEVFSCREVVNMLSSSYSIDFEWLKQKSGEKDYHNFCKMIAK